MLGKEVNINAKAVAAFYGYYVWLVNLEDWCSKENAPMNLKIESRDADLKNRSLHPKKKESLEDSVEPFSPRRTTRQEIKDFHEPVEVKKKNTKLNSSGFGSIGLWAIGLLSVLFAYKRFTNDMQLDEVA